MKTLDHYPLVKVTNDKLGINYTLKPEVWGYNKRTLKDSLDVEKAALRFDVHLGLEGIEENNALLVNVVNYEESIKHNNGIIVFGYDKEEEKWNICTPDHVNKMAMDSGYTVVVEKVYNK